MSRQMTDARLKRLNMRSWRRGTKEMDLILGRFADAELAKLNARQLDDYEALLGENDQELFLWFSGRVAPRAEYSAIVAHILTRGPTA